MIVITVIIFIIVNIVNIVIIIIIVNIVNIVNSVVIIIIVMMTGVVNCPLVGLCYTAVRGSGAFCNGKKLKTSGCNDLSKV